MSIKLILSVWKLDRNFVTSYEKLILIYLADIADEDNHVCINIDNIIEFTSLNQKETKDNIKSLIKKRLLLPVEREEWKPEGEYYVLAL